MEQIKCPHCRSNNVTKTTIGKVSTGAKEVGNVALSVGGHIIGEATGYSIVGKGISAAGKWGLSFTPIEYVCNACDSLFKATFDTEGVIREITLKKLPMPEEIIEKVRDEYIQTCKKKRPFVATVIFGLLALYGFIYFFIGITNDSWFVGGLQIVFGIIFGIIFLIPTIFKGNKIITLNKSIAECEGQSLKEFKNSHKDLFCNYTQYN